MRRRAAWELWQRRAEPGQDARALAAAVRDADAYVRDTCARALRDRLYQAPEALAPLAEALGDPRVEVRRTASDLLPWAYGAAATVVGPLIGALADEDAQVRINAARTISLQLPERVREAVVPLRAAAHDPVAPVRAAAVGALVAVDPDEGPTLAAAAIEDAEPVVRAEALRVLLGVRGRTPADVDTVCRVLREDTAEEVRRRAAFLLGDYERATRQAVPELARAARDDTPGVRVAATVALARLAPFDDRTLPPLDEALWEESTWSVRSAAAGLAAAGPAAAGYVGDLARIVRGGPDEPARWAAADAIGRIVGKLLEDTIPTLEEAADSREDLSSVAAAAALVRLRGDAKRLDELVDRIASGPWREETAHALAALGRRAEPVRAELVRLAASPDADVATAASTALRGLTAAVDGDREQR